jgi:uncharacterized protein
MVNPPEELIEVEITYPQSDEQAVVTLRVPLETTVGQAIELSGVLRNHPEFPGGSLAVGIFGHRVEFAQPLREFDRVEIYRPLIADPKNARRNRAQRRTKAVR